MDVQAIRRILNTKFVKYGLPFFIVVVGGSIGLREFTQLKYQFSKVTPLDREELKKLGIKMKKPGEVTLESEYEKIKDLDFDNWEQVRGPRPWEEDTMKQKK